MLPLVKKAIRIWFDNHWIVDCTPVPCGMSRSTVKRSEMAGWAGYGYCASHSRFSWGLRLYLVCTPVGMPILWALANPKMGEREVLQAMLDIDAGLIAERPGLLLISDKGFASKEFENDLAMRGITLLRPSFKREKKRTGEGLLKSVRQLIESVNDTLNGQLDLEQHGGRTHEGVAIRVAPWPQPSGTTTRPTSPSPAHSSPTTTEQNATHRNNSSLARKSTRRGLLRHTLGRGIVCLDSPSPHGCTSHPIKPREEGPAGSGPVEPGVIPARQPTRDLARYHPRPGIKTTSRAQDQRTPAVKQRGWDVPHWAWGIRVASRMKEAHG